MGKDSPSPPPAPDYKGAAQSTSQGSTQAAIANALLNRSNVSTPLGSQTWRNTGRTTNVPAIGDQPAFDLPEWEQQISMTPEGQGLYDQQMGLSKGLMGLGQNSLDQTTASLGKPQDFSSVQDIADQSYAAQTSRLDPQWRQREEQERVRLANQGVSPGGEAYTNSMRDLNQGRNDAYTQARQQAISTMPQTYQLATARRMQPLTELNAIRSGAQPQMPQFQPTPSAGGVQGPNMIGAAGAQNQYDMGLYNSQVGQQNSMTSGLFGLAGAASRFIPWSDRRLKRDIRKVADDPRGFSWYSFRYLWSDRHQVGVMADEVPHAAILHPNGFMQVDYGRL